MLLLLVANLFFYCRREAVGLTFSLFTFSLLFQCFCFLLSLSFFSNCHVPFQGAFIHRSIKNVLIFFAVSICSHVII
jgi:hypothetical protein